MVEPRAAKRAIEREYVTEGSVDLLTAIRSYAGEYRATGRADELAARRRTTERVRESLLCGGREAKTRRSDNPVSLRSFC
jgi:hypothetical protein